MAPEPRPRTPDRSARALKHRSHGVTLAVHSPGVAGRPRVPLLGHAPRGAGEAPGLACALAERRGHRPGHRRERVPPADLKGPWKPDGGAAGGALRAVPLSPSHSFGACAPRVPALGTPLGLGLWGSSTLAAWSGAFTQDGWSCLHLGRPRECHLGPSSSQVGTELLALGLPHPRTKSQTWLDETFSGSHLYRWKAATRGRRPSGVFCPRLSKFSPN